MTPSEPVPAPSEPQRPPLPLPPPGAALPQPPTALYAAEPTPVSPWTESLDPAPVPARVLAAAIDFLLTLVVALPVAALLLFIGASWAFSGFGTGITLIVLSVLALVLIPLAAGILRVRRIRSRGDTVGMRKMRISIVDARTGRSVTTRQAVIRAAVLVVPSLVTVGALNLVWVLYVGYPHTYGMSFSGLSSLGLIAPVVWAAALVWMSVGDRRGPWDSASGTRVVTAQSVWWAENGIPNPRLAPDAAASDASDASVPSEGS
jgi:hypothetical protein